MKILAATLCALSVLTTIQPSFAQRYDRDDRFERERDRDWDRDHDRRGPPPPRWQRGDRLPPEFRGDRFVVYDWREAHLRPPPPGHRWVLIDGNYFLAGRGWVVVDMAPMMAMAPPPPPPPPPPGYDREERWRARYGRQYGSQDDPTYTQCKREVDPAGAIFGAVVGGLLGNAAGGRHDKAGATFAGVIAGGAIGAALSSKMTCEDRSYAYKTYNEGFNAGRADADYQWRNPDNGNHGDFKVVDYYKDEDGFRCSVYASTVYINGKPEQAKGRACQQPDGSWAIID